MSSSSSSEELRSAYQHWFGRTLVLSGIQNPRYRGKDALCVGYDEPSDRLIVWPLDIGNQILVEAHKTSQKPRFTIHDCRGRNTTTDGQEQRTRGSAGVASNDNADDICSICLEPPRAPLTLPCSHRFCGSCISRLRSPNDNDFDVMCCPNCRAPMPALLEQLIVKADSIVRIMMDETTCNSDECVHVSRRHCANGVLVEIALNSIHAARDKTIETDDFISYLYSLETTLDMIRDGATEGHAASSPIKVHRDLMRNMVCTVVPKLAMLRTEYEGCLHVRSACGGIDQKLETLHQEIYGKPLLSPEELREITASMNSLVVTPDDDGKHVFIQLDEKMNTGEVKIVLENIEGAWCYIRSFGRNYARILNAFGNAVGQLIAHDPDLGLKITQEIVVDEWVMRRLDALQELLSTRGFSKEESTETFSLMQLLYNAIFPAFEKHHMQMDRFVMKFGQEYFWREIEGATDLNVRAMLSSNIGDQIRKFGDLYLDENNRPLLMLRPCAQARSRPLRGCRVKESRPNEFIRCSCRRMAYCSPLCLELHQGVHSTACDNALKSSNRPT